jgi:hypothetical protein
MIHAHAHVESERARDEGDWEGAAARGTRTYHGNAWLDKGIHKRAYIHTYIRTFTSTQAFPMAHLDLLGIAVLTFPSVCVRVYVCILGG